MTLRKQIDLWHWRWKHSFRNTHWEIRANGWIKWKCRKCGEEWPPA